jgi:hypothetical protein
MNVFVENKVVMQKGMPPGAKRSFSTTLFFLCFIFACSFLPALAQDGYRLVEVGFRRQAGQDRLTDLKHNGGPAYARLELQYWVGGFPQNIPENLVFPPITITPGPGVPNKVKPTVPGQGWVKNPGLGYFYILEIETDEVFYANHIPIEFPYRNWSGHQKNGMKIS